MQQQEICKRTREERGRDRECVCAREKTFFHYLFPSFYAYTHIHSSLSSSNKYIFEDPSTPLYGTLTIRNVSLTDAGIYTCIVSNVHMTQSANALLQVQCKY